MQVVTERCAGLDVHQASVVACLLVCVPGMQPRKEVRSFGTMTHELEDLREWLQQEGVTHVGMESTGVYWRPVHTVLEGHFELIVGNARHIRNVPGRKTDVKDAEWIADLVCHGLIQPSFVPAKPLRALRELLRYRRKLVEGQSAERNRLQKLLETANIKLASVATDVLGVSGRAMLRALIEGTASPQQMAELARGRLRRKRAELVRALEGHIEAHHRVLLSMQLRHAGVERLDSRGSLQPEIPLRVDVSNAQDPDTASMEDRPATNGVGRGGGALGAVLTNQDAGGPISPSHEHRFGAVVDDSRGDRSENRRFERSAAAVTQGDEIGVEHQCLI